MKEKLCATWFPEGKKKRDSVMEPIKLGNSHVPTHFNIDSAG